MLRFAFFILLLTGILSPIFSQKQDNVWVFGYRYYEDSLANGIYFKFDDSLRISYMPKPMDFAASSASISDSTGNLLIYSNGCYIENANGLEVFGSSGLNPGIMYDIFCAYGDGYNLTQNMILLPAPGDTSHLYLFHLPVVQEDQFVFTKNILYTQIDLVANNGNGGILFKNNIIVSDTIDADGLHAVRHANGRDWWIIGAKLKSNKYYTVLLSTTGVITTQQSIGVPTISGAGGEIVFSPDGTKMARFNTRDDLRIFDFNRCTGTLSNPVFISIQDDADNNFFAGLAWSADGHYLYAAEIKRILQFDMWASDIAASKSIVAERDTEYSCPFEVNLAYLELGPDGYIYGRSLGGQNCMHRIKYPERSGVACEVQQHYYSFDYPYVNLPHFPNFRLGPIDGSPCDTLGINNHPLAGWRYDRTGGASVDFTSVSWYEPDAWLWDFGDGTQSTERNPAHVFPGPGAYEVCLQVSNQYGSDTKCKTVWVTTVGTGSPEEDNAITLFPNPATNTVYWRGTGSELIHFKLFNQLGQVKLSKETDEGFAQLSSIFPGFYTVQILSQEGTLLTAQRLIIQ